MLKRRFLAFCCTILLSLSFSTYSVYAKEVSVEFSEEPGPVEEFNLFDSFIESDKEQILSFLESDNIENIGSGYAYIQNENSNIKIPRLYITLKNGEQYYYNDIMGDVIPFVELSGYELNEITIPTQNVNLNSGSSNVWNSFMVFMLIGFTCVFCCRFYLLKKQGNRVTVNHNSDSKAIDKSIPDVHFDDVEGIDGLKADVLRLVDCLKNPEKYKAIGARPPKGVILYGPPGTGKTLLAKAIAGEAGVPFFSAVGSDFVEMYVGVGAKRVRELYKKARQAAPCIVFIDEVDAVAGNRGNNNNNESDQTVNALLAELDGFGSSQNIVTICATNRLDMLDAAFTRAGRFDLKLAVGLPDKKSRLKILQIHSRNKKLSEDVSLENIANLTVGFSGADLEALLNEAAMNAVGRDVQIIEKIDIDEAFFKIVMKGNKKPREEINETNKIVAWHESGHALASKLLRKESVPSVTIVGSTSGALGVTMRSPDEEVMMDKKALRELVSVYYAGRAAEELLLGDTEKITTGAAMDIKEATDIIKRYIGIYGMGDFGMLDITQFTQDYTKLLKEASELAKDTYEFTKKFLIDNFDLLSRLASSLLEKETLNESEIDEILASRTL